MNEMQYQEEIERLEKELERSRDISRDRMNEINRLRIVVRKTDSLLDEREEEIHQLRLKVKELGGQL